MTSNKTTHSPMRNGNATVPKSVFNGITSTPLPSPRSRLSKSLFSPSKITPLRTPPRYSLSETPNRSETSSKSTSSPLLKSVKYNSNLAAYTDGKSPGLHTRIVQYSNEARNNLPVTHQAKYGSPGLFPVVHFFKKETPVISPKPKRVMVRLASPDIRWYNSSTYNKHNLNDNGDNRNGHHSPQISTDTETRSVLDALREISRKRIHTSSQLDSTPNSSCKKQKCADSDAEAYETNKRPREESPKSDASSPTTATLHQPKKICVVDVLAASFTSSQLLKEKMRSVLKRKAEVEIEKSIEDVGAKRQTILSNAETQTINIETNVAPQKLPEVSTIAAVTAKATEETNETDDGKKEKQEETPQRYSNIFDEKKLEIQRKNKLAILLGAITGEKPNLILYTAPTDEKVEKETSTENKLVSILSPMNKVKHDKHVHFNLTPEVKSIDNATPVIPEIAGEKKSNEPITDNTMNSETSKSAPQSKLDIGLIIQSSSATLSTTTTTTSTLSSPIVTTMVSSTNTNANEPSEINPISTLPFSFGKTPTSNNLETPKATVVSTSSQVSGGFKFNLSPTNIKTSTPTSTLDLAPKSTNSNMALFNFVGTPKSAIAGNTSAASSASNTLNTIPKSLSANFASGTINFAAEKPQATLPAFGVNTNTTINLNSPPSTFGLTTITSSKPLITTASNISTFAGFGAVSTSSMITSTQPTFTFGGGKTTSAFGTSTTTTPQFGTNPTTVFGITTTSTAAFNTAASTPAFDITGNLGSNTSAASAFGTPTGSTAFGNPTSGFGTITSRSGTPGLNTTTSGLGTTSGRTTTTSTPSFGITSSTTGFGTNTLTPTFGATTSASIFGASTSTPAFSLETPPGFGVATTSSGFGTITPAFGAITTSTPTFGVPTSSGFGTPAAGLPKPSGQPFNFNSGNNLGTSGFGGNSFGAPTTSASSAFGNANTTAGFGGFGTPAMTSAGFGTSTTNTSAFGVGGNGTSKFGGAGFGVPNTTSPPTGFGTNNVFGATTTASSGFGSGGTFGTATPPNAVFGNNAFGSKTQTTASSVFGNSTFGTTTTANSTFGTNTTGFGNQSITNFFGKNTTSNFTVATTAPPTFTSNSATPNKPFTFGAGTANNTGFNNSSTQFNFGTTNPPGFVDNKQAGFGTTFPSNGFGSNTSTTTSTGTNSTTSIFGSSTGFGSSGFGASTFGGNNNPAPPFGNANTFASPSNNTAFGTSNNTTNNTFGTSTNTPNFGFGNGDAASTFTKPQAPPGFSTGSGDSTFQFGGGNNNISTPVFGSVNPTSNTSAGTGQVFSFGASNPSSSSSTGVFAFGTPDQKSTFPNSNNTTGFATGTPTFGSNTVTGNFGTPQFGAPTAGMFSIGSGSSTGPRQRHQLKAKRRT